MTQSELRSAVAVALIGVLFDLEWFTASLGLVRARAVAEGPVL